MKSWVRNGPVVVEVDGTAEGMRVVDYACVEALRSDADLVLVASRADPKRGPHHLTVVERERLLELRRPDVVAPTY